MPKKQRRLEYRCTLGDDTQDDSEANYEDPTLSGGLPRNSEDTDDCQLLRTDNEDEECEQDEGKQDEEEHEGEEDDENDFDSTTPILQMRKMLKRQRTAVTVALPALAPLSAPNGHQALLRRSANGRSGL